MEERNSRWRGGDRWGFSGSKEGGRGEKERDGVGGFVGAEVERGKRKI